MLYSTIEIVLGYYSTVKLWDQAGLVQNIKLMKNKATKINLSNRGCSIEEVKLGPTGFKY
jgi:hypothetical protein